MGTMTNAMHRALVIENDTAIQSVLHTLLEGQALRVIVADNYRRGELDARAWRPDIIVVNVGLMDPRGINFIRALRVWSATPVLALSASATAAQRLAAFDVGADDYVEVPFSTLEFAARIRALLRRHARCDLPQAMLRLGDVCVDLERRSVRHRDGRTVRLTPLEYRILEILARRPDQIVTHNQLIRQVWGPDVTDLGVVRVYISSLRRKLERDPQIPRHIVTEFGLGYRLVTDAKSVTASIPNLTHSLLTDARFALAGGRPH
jgi:two-component system KDP operon response regulator KdpE